MNDSMLKIDAINKFYKNWHHIIGAINIVGFKRFKAIITTSLTTIVGLMSFLIFYDIGSGLQKPLQSL